MPPLYPRHCEEFLRRSNPDCRRGDTLGCFAALEMTRTQAPSRAALGAAASLPRRLDLPHDRDRRQRAGVVDLFPGLR
ncbi:hypothetical protein CV770_31850 [Bradyrhizobium sp. AC87j1]|nr:hypothetical protein CV770_31850 [Bradyrhizobium sp. AC87j1]